MNLLSDQAEVGWLEVPKAPPTTQRGEENALSNSCMPEKIFGNRPKNFFFFRDLVVFQTFVAPIFRTFKYDFTIEW